MVIKYFLTCVWKRETSRYEGSIAIHIGFDNTQVKESMKHFSLRELEEKLVEAIKAVCAKAGTTKLVKYKANLPSEELQLPGIEIELLERDSSDDYDFGFDEANIVPY